MKLLVAHPASPDPRSPLVPEVAKKWIDRGLAVAVERGVGLEAGCAETAWSAAGCAVVEPGTGWGDAEVVALVGPPSVDRVRGMKPGAVLIALLSPTTQPELVRACVQAGVTAVALEFIPRTSRAQAMDVLSSQANLAGYKAAVLAAEKLPKLMPMMITAAGTLRPAKVFVLGVGVAGLQAIATAKRLGAQVEAFDVRTATREQVQSLGARFIELDLGEDASTAGGYARELTDEQKRQQTALMARHIRQADAVITTAAVFGKAPPLLIPADVADGMAPGSVLVDLAASADHGRGNCERTVPGQVVTTDAGVTVVGTLNLPATVPVHASQAFANNLDALLKELVRPETPAKAAKDQTPAVPAAPASLNLNLDDDIQRGCVIVHDGTIRNDLVQQALNPR